MLLLMVPLIFSPPLTGTPTILLTSFWVRATWGCCGNDETFLGEEIVRPDRVFLYDIIDLKMKFLCFIKTLHNIISTQNKTWSNYLIYLVKSFLHFSLDHLLVFILFLHLLLLFFHLLVKSSSWNMMLAGSPEFTPCAVYAVKGVAS